MSVVHVVSMSGGKDSAATAIHAVVEWARTTRGRRQFSLLEQLDEPTACSSAYGLCE